MAIPIKNAKDVPLFANPGTLPNVQGAMQSWFLPMTFEKVVKVIENGIVQETTTPVDFQGVWQPLTARKLMLKPEGQRGWKWFMLHAFPALVANLSLDDVVLYRGVQFRVMELLNYKEYGYLEYHLVQDYTGSGPTVEMP